MDRPRRCSWLRGGGHRAGHTQLRQFRDGSIGVDVFFVLSGFLITTLLLREHRLTGTIRFKSFYVRRILRLYPALVLAALGIVVLGLMTHEEPDRLCLSAGASLFYVGNLANYSGRGSILFSHMWSLALEEQFYVVWPAVVLLLLNARRALRVVVVSAIASFWIILALLPSMPEHVL
jgi:peptidoglycan/LPS O-acetylase OafA/YrhL